MARKALLANHVIHSVLDNLIAFVERPDLLEKKVLLDDLQRAGFDRIFLFARQLKEQISESSDAEVSFPALNTYKTASRTSSASSMRFSRIRIRAT